MPTRIKICGITRVEDALVAARAGADAIGLNFWAATPRAIQVPQAQAIVRALPPFVAVIGLFVDPSADQVNAVIGAVPLHALQFHGHEPPAFCRAFGRPYLKAIAVDASVDLLESVALYDDAAGLLFDAPPLEGMPGGTGRSFDWSRLPEVLPRPLVLSGGLNAGNVARAIRLVRPWAVDVSSGVEASAADGRPRPGIKDPAKIAAFVEEVRHADV